MKHSADLPYQWITVLTVSFLFGADVLRSLIIYWGRSEVYQALGLMAVWLLLLVSESVISRRVRWYFPLYLVFQAALIVTLLSMQGDPDYFAILFAILSIQVMQHFTPRAGAIWIAVFSILTLVVSLDSDGGVFQAVSLTLIYLAANALFAAYALATLRAQAARAQNQLLVQELQEKNQELQIYATQLEHLAVARERSHLARELHDSVTQTIFSMTLAAQSAILLLTQDAKRVEDQLERLNQLAGSALVEIQTLITELRPEKILSGGLASALRRHLAERHLPESLSISMEVEAEQTLAPAEEQGLFRIVQEALNNIVKHAEASHVWIRLHLAVPSWIEIEDQGRGFDLGQVQSGGGIGLTSMRERAKEIGWELQFITSPGTGTRIRVEKNQAERQVS